MRLEVGGEIGVEDGAQTVAVGGEKVEGLVAVAEPPFARGRVKGEAGSFHEIDGAGVERVLGRGEREGEEVFGAVDRQRLRRCGISDSQFLIFDWAGRLRRRGRGRRSAEEGGVAPDAGLAVVDEDGLEGGGGGEVAELGSGELEEGGRGGGAAEPLEVSENREKSGCGDGGGVELDLDRNRVAQDGGGEVGREDEAEHRAEEKMDCFGAGGPRNDKISESPGNKSPGGKLRRPYTHE